MNINHFMSEGASPDGAAHDHPAHRPRARWTSGVTPDTPPGRDGARSSTRAVADHRERTPGDHLHGADRRPARQLHLAGRGRSSAGCCACSSEHGDGRAGGAADARRHAAAPGSSRSCSGSPPLDPAANSDNQQHDVNEHYVLRHFFAQTALYTDVVASRPA